MKTKSIVGDTALVMLVLIGIVFIGGIVNGEASGWILALALGVLCAFALGRKHKAKFKSKVRHLDLDAFSDYRNVA